RAGEVPDRSHPRRRCRGDFVAVGGRASGGSLEHLHLGRRCRRVGREGARGRRERRQSGGGVGGGGAVASASRWMWRKRAGWPCSRTRKGPFSPSGRRGSTRERGSSTNTGR